MIIEKILLNLVLLLFMTKSANHRINQSSNISGFRLLHMAEENFRDTVKSVIKLIQKFKNHIVTWHAIRFFRLSGSLREGSFSSKMFHRKKEFDGNVISKELDIDMEWTIAYLPQKYHHCINDMDRKPGFLNWDISPNSSCLCFECLTVDSENAKEHILDILSRHKKNGNSTNLFLSSYYLKELIIGGEDDKPHLIKFFLSLLSIPIVGKLQVESGQKVTKSTMEELYKVYIDNKLYGSLTIDLAFIVKLEWTPKLLEYWLYRKRNWPTIKELGNEFNQGYIIAKTSQEEKFNTESLEFRYTFSYLERRIISLQTPNQRLIFLIAKSMFYRWLKPIDENLSSFLIKNTMFWKCESYPPTHPFWGDGSDAAIIKVVRSLYQDLHTMLKDGKIPYYFIPDINIVSDISSSILIKLIPQINRIVLDIETYLPSNTQEVLELIAHSDQLVRERVEFFNQLMSDDFIFFQ